MTGVSRRTTSAQTLRWLAKPVVFLVCLLPFVSLLLATFELGGRTLGANPIETLMDQCGRWGLRFLLITLAVTPLRRLTGWHGLIRFRRMLGLFAFFYIALHFTIYLLLDRELVLADIIEDIAERPFITIGFTAFLLLIPLAVTSTKGMMRRLGRRWQQLHRIVYVIPILGVWHYYWQVKLDVLDPLIYAAILSLLLGFRIWYGWRQRQRRLAIVESTSSS